MPTLHVEFDSKVYTQHSLHAAMYRMIGVAVGKIREEMGSLICELSILDDGADLRQIENRFLELVADEALRERLNIQTEPLRNVILSLAFGALASEGCNSARSDHEIPAA